MSMSRPRGPSSSTYLAPASRAHASWAARLSPPKEGSIALADRTPDTPRHGVFIGIPEVGGEAADIILRPDPERALLTLNVFEYYDGEIVMPAIPIKRE